MNTPRLKFLYSHKLMNVISRTSTIFHKMFQNSKTINIKYSSSKQLHRKPGKVQKYLLMNHKLQSSNCSRSQVKFGRIITFPSSQKAVGRETRGRPDD